MATLCWLMLLVGLLVPLTESQTTLLLSDKFQATSNSTCSNNAFANASCSSPAQHNPNAVLDKAISTWWESIENETPVLFSFSSEVNLTGFSLSINIRFQNNSFPYSIGLYSSRGYLQEFLSLNCSSVNISICRELAFVLQAGNVAEVHLTYLTISTSSNEFDLVFFGFQGSLMHYEVQEITINGIINDGFYLPGLHSTLAEVENGIIINSFGYINVGFNKTVFPNFSGPGYAILMSNETIQMMLTVNHNTSFENLFLHYINKGSENVIVLATVVQNGISCNVRFLCNVCHNSCFSRAESNCSNHNTLTSGVVTIIIQAHGSDLLLDYISAVPNVFQSTINMCDDIDSLNESCTLSALRQSLDLNLSLQECQCSSAYSINSTCEIYGGQCPCNEIGGHRGRQCTECIYSQYSNETLGCLDCECLNNASCSIDGQCSYLGILLILPPPIFFPPPINCSMNTTGEFCELCADGYYNSSVTEELNCTLCPCDEPNSNKSCQVVDMEPMCFCNTSFMGPLCKSCLHGCYGPSCESCDCGVGAVNESCNATGHCYCNDKVYGDKCQECQKYHHSISNIGCDECNSCINSLRQNVVTFEAKLTTVDSMALMADNLQSNDTLNLLALQTSVNILQSRCNITLINLLKGLMNFSGMPDDVMDIVINLAVLRDLVNDLLINATTTLPNAELVFHQVRDFHNRLGDTVSVDYTMKFVDALETRMKLLLNNSNINISLISLSVSSLSQQSLTNNLSTIQIYIKDINDTEKLMMYLWNQTLTERNNIRTETSDTDYLVVTLNQLQTKISQLSTIVKSYNVSALKNQYNLLEFMNYNISILVNQSLLLMGNSENNLNSVTKILSMASADIHILQNKIDNMRMFIGSGSGQFLSEQNTYEQLITLNATVNQLTERFQINLETYLSAIQSANSTESQAQRLCRIINLSFYAGNMAVDAIMNYTLVNDTLWLANDLILLTNTTLSNVLCELDLLMSGVLETNLTMTIDTTLSLTSDVQNLNTTAIGLTTRYNLVSERFNMVDNNLNLILEAIELLSNEYYNVQSNTTMATHIIPSKLLETLHNINVTNLTFINMKDFHSSFFGNVNVLTTELNELTVNSTRINSNAMMTNDTSLDAQDSFLERMDYLNLINVENSELVTEIGTSKKALIDLHQQLIEAQEAAALVDIALKFHGNGTSSYNLSQTPQEITHISLYFRPDSYTGVLLTDDWNNTLQLENGQVKWSSGDKELTTAGFNINLNEWYQIEASTDKSFLFLSVAPLQEPSESTVTVNTPAISNVFPLNSYIILAGNNDSYYSGCLDRVIVNGERLPLLLPNATDVDIKACGPRSAAEVSRVLETSAWFQGQSQLSLSPIFFTESPITFSFLFKTYSQASQLALIQNSNIMQSVSVYINDSVINLQVSFENDNQSLVSSIIVNDGAWHSVMVSIDDIEYTLTVDQVTVIKSINMLHQNLSSPVNIVFGGLSGLSIPSFSGCLSNFIFEDAFVDFTVSEIVQRVELTGCPSSVSPGTRFMGTGLATFSINKFVNSVSFSFRTVHLSSVLLALSNRMLPDRLIVSLFHTHVRVEMVNTFNDIIVTSSKLNLNNGFWHNVSVSLDENRLVLVVDGNSSCEMVANNTNFLYILGDVTVGGLPNDWPRQELVTDNYRGCFNDFIINGENYDFNNAVLSSGVALFGCREEMTMGSGSADHSTILLPSSTVVPTFISSTEFIPSTMVLMPSSTEFLPSTELLPSTTELLPSSTALPPSSNELLPSSTELLSSSTESILSSTKLNPSSIELMPSSTEFAISSTELISSFTEFLSSSTELVSSSTELMPSSTEVISFSTEVSPPTEVLPSSTTIPEISPTSTPIIPIGLNGQQGSFLSYSTTDLTHRFSITLTFRTGSSNVLLLYSQHNSLVDYMALELRNGELYYSYDLGAGAVFINSSPLYRYDDNTNHTVSIVRDTTRGQLIVDGENFTGSSISTHTELNTDNNLLFVGGVSSSLSSYSLYNDYTQFPPGALACFYSLVIDNQIIHLSNDLHAANGMVSCQESYSDHVSFNGSGFSILVDIYKPLVSYGFRLDFRTVKCTGLILYSSSLFHDDHTALEILKGKIRFVFDNGNGPGIVEFIPANLSSLCDGNWHHIQATKNGGTGSLVVDEHPPNTTTTGFLSVDTFSPLYAGGVPDDVLVRYTVTSEAFRGCMNNVQLIDSNQDGDDIITNVNFSNSTGVITNTCHL